MKLRFNLKKVATTAACLAAAVVFFGCDDPNSRIDGKGSSRERAIPVTVGFSESYTIQSSGEHWFKFIGTGEPVIFETKGDVVDTYIVVP